MRGNSTTTGSTVFESALDSGSCLFMVTVIQDSPSSAAGLNESSKVLFDYPDADVVLRSRDSQTFRVLKLYLIKTSSILGELMLRASSDTADASNSASVQTQLPEVQLSESSAILSSLLTFIFPVNPVLPSTLEETMEILSIAQKYEMSTVLTHIRGFLSRQRPLFISPENAFLAYSLAQRYGLREEVTQAARLSLKFVLAIETLEDKLAIMPGAYLHELWKYHQRVQAQLKLDLPSSGTRELLNGFNCAQYSVDGNPYWLELYIWSIIENPSRFDSIEFQIALARHTAGSGTTRCSSCILIPVEKMRTFWTTLAATVHLCMEKAESELSILGTVTETSPRCHMGSPVVHSPLPECLDLSEADVIVRTSDLTSFLVHKSVLASSSWVFRDMFSLPRPPNNEMVNGLPVVDISEDAELVRSLITMLYPIPSEIPASYDRTLALLAATQKYDMSAVQCSIRAEVARRPPLTLDGAQAFRAYAIASSSGLRPEMEMAACLTLDQPMTFEHLGDELRLFEGRTLRELASFRKGCRNNLVSCIESFLDVDSGPSNIWIDCPKHPKKSPPTLPTWVHNLFTPLVEELKQAFTSPLIKPSSIRDKYLEALQKHAAPDLCTFCLGVHALKGESFCVQLEKALAQAREKMPVVLDTATTEL
ncbi:hypothetical protein EDB83DRAFT_2679040 [Lactarius deliciosus]|nr:hypothetical protein EDB83DRAFT_2679040 [Lactarius deliciosus]